MEIVIVVALFILLHVSAALFRAGRLNLACPSFFFTGIIVGVIVGRGLVLGGIWP